MVKKVRPFHRAILLHPLGPSSGRWNSSNLKPKLLNLREFHVSFTSILLIATEYIRVWAILVYKGRGGIYRGIYVPLTLFGVGR